MGDADKDPTTNNGEALSDFVGTQVPLVLGVGYRLNPLLSLGGIFQYSAGSVSSNVCPSGVDCSSSDVRLGVEARLHFLTDQAFAPWVSAGMGYEWLNISMSNQGQSASMTVEGVELLNLEVGGDIRMSPSFVLAPFVGVRLGRYASMSGTDTSGTSQSGDITSQTIHAWFSLGVRGAFTL
jgi:opacity protein-like surface antigen